MIFETEFSKLVFLKTACLASSVKERDTDSLVVGKSGDAWSCKTANRDVCSRGDSFDDIASVPLHCSNSFAVLVESTPIATCFAETRYSILSVRSLPAVHEKQSLQPHWEPRACSNISTRLMTSKTPAPVSRFLRSGRIEITLRVPSSRIVGLVVQSSRAKQAFSSFSGTSRSLWQVSKYPHKVDNNVAGMRA